MIFKAALRKAGVRIRVEITRVPSTFKKKQIRTRSLGRQFYIITLVNEYSKVLPFSIQNPDQGPSFFLKFRIWIRPTHPDPDLQPWLKDWTVEVRAFINVIVIDFMQGASIMFSFFHYFTIFLSFTILLSSFLPFFRSYRSRSLCR